MDPSETDKRERTPVQSQFKKYDMSLMGFKPDELNHVMTLALDSLERSDPDDGNG